MSEATILQRLAEIRSELGPAYVMDPLPDGGAVERRLRAETPEEEQLSAELAELTIDRRPLTDAEAAWVAERVPLTDEQRRDLTTKARGL